MSIEQIAVCATSMTLVSTIVILSIDIGKQLLVDMVSLLSIMQSSPQIDTPSG